MPAPAFLSPSAFLLFSGLGFFFAEADGDAVGVGVGELEVNAPAGGCPSPGSTVLAAAAGGCFFS